MILVSPSGSFAGSMRNTRRSSPTSTVNGRAPPNVAKTSTRSAVVSPWGTDAKPAVTTRRPGPTLPASMLRPIRETDRGSPSAIEVWATRPRAESNAGTDPGGANATGICISVRSSAASVAPASMSWVAIVTPTWGPVSARPSEAREASARTRRNEAIAHAAATLRKILEDSGSLRRNENAGTMRIRGTYAAHARPAVTEVTSVDRSEVILLLGIERKRPDAELLERLAPHDHGDGFADPFAQLLLVRLAHESELDADQLPGHQSCPEPPRACAQSQPLRSSGTRGIAANSRSRNLSTFSPKTFSTSACETGAIPSTPTS